MQNHPILIKVTDWKREIAAGRKHQKTGATRGDTITGTGTDRDQGMRGNVTHDIMGKEEDITAIRKEEATKKVKTEEKTSTVLPQKIEMKKAKTKIP